MDQYLRELERLALTGDREAQEKLQLAYDRLSQPYPESLTQLLETQEKWELDPQYGRPDVWRQIGGDVGCSDYGCVLGRIINTWVELWSIESVVNHIGEKEAREVGAPFWVSNQDYDFDDLLDLDLKDITEEKDSEQTEPGHSTDEADYRERQRLRQIQKIISALKSMDVEPEDWNDFSYLIRAEILHSYEGSGDSENAWGPAALPVAAEEILWWAHPQTTEEWIGDSENFRHSVMWDCFTCPKCGARSSIEGIRDYGPGPAEIHLQQWPWTDEGRGGRCGCQMPLRYFLTRIQSNQPEIPCSQCRQELEEYS